MRNDEWIFSTACAVHDLCAALRVANVHAEEKLDHRMKNPARKLAPAGLGLMQHRSGQPARTNHTIRLAAAPDQIMKRLRARRAVRVHITDQVRQRREFQALDQRAALPDRRGEFQRLHRRMFLRDAPDDAQRVVPAAVEHHHQLKFPGVMPLKIFRKCGQHRFDPVFFVISWNQQHEAGRGLSHPYQLAENPPLANLYRATPRRRANISDAGSGGFRRARPGFKRLFDQRWAALSDWKIILTRLTTRLMPVRKDDNIWCISNREPQFLIHFSHHFFQF